MLLSIKYLAKKKSGKFRIEMDDFFLPSSNFGKSFMSVCLPIVLRQNWQRSSWVALSKVRFKKGKVHLKKCTTFSFYYKHFFKLFIYLPLTLASGPRNVDSPGWEKYCKLLLEYLRKVSAVRRARVHAFRNASFCSWCLLINCAISVTLSWGSFEPGWPADAGLAPWGGRPVRLFPWREIQSSSRLYSRSRLSRTEQTCGKRQRERGKDTEVQSKKYPRKYFFQYQYFFLFFFGKGHTKECTSKRSITRNEEPPKYQ